MKVFISGKLYEEEDASISVFDHGLLYGDGVFEGIRIYNKRIFLLNEHIDRLFNSAKAIALDIPVSKEELCNNVIETCKANDIEDGYIRLVITRGKGTLDLIHIFAVSLKLLLLQLKFNFILRNFIEMVLK